MMIRSTNLVAALAISPLPPPPPPHSQKLQKTLRRSACRHDSQVTHFWIPNLVACQEPEHIKLMRARDLVVMDLLAIARDHSPNVSLQLQARA